MTKVVCPKCRRVVSFSKPVPRGAKMNCPACGTLFRISEPGRPVSQMPADVVRPEHFVVMPTQAGVPTWEEDASPPTWSTCATTTSTRRPRGSTTPQPNRENPVAIAALVLGILAALVAFVPFLGLLAVPTGLLGSLLGSVVILYRRVTGRGRAATAGVGVGLSVGSIVLSIVMTGLAAKGIDGGLNKAKLQSTTVKDPTLGPTVKKPGAAEAHPLPPGLPPTDDLDRIADDLEKTGFSLAERKQIFRALCVAELRARWEADRLYPLSESPTENQGYAERMIPKYEDQVREKYRLSARSEELIVAEAAIRRWPTPGRSSVDAGEWVKGLGEMGVAPKVYKKRGEPVYHRDGCPLLGDTRKALRMTLREAAAHEDWSACKNCDP